MRSPSRPRSLRVFYLFVVTAFVANAIVRDDSSGFAPIVRATSVTSTQIVLGRFLGGLIVAWLGYLAVPLGMAIGSIMPWVDPETVGPQKFSYYAWTFAIFALPNIFLISALLFALATMLRSMMAAYIGAIAAGDGLSRHDQHRWPEDRISRDVRAVGAARQRRACARRRAIGPRAR